MEDFEDLLMTWGLEAYVQNFRDQKMDLFTLTHMDTDDLKELIPSVGDRTRFKQRRSEWIENAEKIKKTTEAVSSDTNTNTASVGDLNGNFQVIANCNAILPVQLMEEDEPLEIIRDEIVPVLDTVGSTSKAIHENNSQAKRSKTYDLLDILNSTDDGKMVVSLYNKGGKFQDDHHRQLLATCVIKEELKQDPDHTITRDRFQFLSKEIKKRFPSESELIWYERYQDSKSKKVVATGRLVWKYYNMRRLYINCGLICKNKQRTSEESDEDEPQEAERDVAASLLWLESNTSPWDKVIEHWRKTYTFRSSTARNLSKQASTPASVRDLISKYSCLQQQNGYQLFELDFNQRYSSCSMALFEEWAIFSEFVQNEIKSKNPNFLSDAIYSDAEKILIVLLSVSKLFPVVTVATKKGKGKKNSNTEPDGNNVLTLNGKKAWRPSKVQMQEGFLLIAPTIVKMHEILKARRDLLFDLGLTLQPLAVVIGERENPERYMVVIDDFFYDVESPLKAVDTVFKCFHALNLNYPPEAEQAWLFVQRKVYGFTTRYDKHYAALQTLSSSYDCFKNKLSGA